MGAGACVRLEKKFCPLFAPFRVLCVANVCLALFGGHVGVCLYFVVFVLGVRHHVESCTVYKRGLIRYRPPPFRRGLGGPPRLRAGPCTIRTPGCLVVMPLDVRGILGWRCA